MKVKVPFLDLRIPDGEEKKALLRAVERVFSHGRIVLGPEVEMFERKAANFCKRKYAVGVNSGTDALILGLKSMGIKAGDEVITTSFSWVATANSIAIIGAVPVFADIGDDLNIDPQSIGRLITSKTRAIMPVHYTGRVCKMDQIQNISRKYDIPIIEDAAQSFGASYKGKTAGTFGQVACFSMNPMKVLGALGEAGAVVTDDRVIYECLLSLRYNGTINREKCVEVSLNARIDTIQAAILLERFKRFKKNIAARRKNARYYNLHLQAVKRIISLPKESKDEQQVYYTYTIRAQKRDKLKEFLNRRGIETKIQHPYLMPDQPVYKNSPRDILTNANRIIKEILCLPANEKITTGDMDYVIKNIKEFYS